MGLRQLVLLAAAAIVVGVLATSAPASTSASRPPGSPDLAAMALAVTDLPKTSTIEGQRYVRDSDYVASYEREFAVRGGRLGKSRLLGLFESLDVSKTLEDAAFDFQLAAAVFSGKAGKELIQAIFAEAAGDTSLTVSVGKIRHPRIGHGTISIPVRMKAVGISFDMTLVLLRFDRVLVAVGAIGMPGRRVFPADTDRISRVAVERVKAGLVPALKVAPAVSGTAQPGQVLTAAPGTWRGDQLQFAYQWERCDAAGAGCVALSGATTTTYTATAGDLASTIRVTVTARNRLGTVASSSAPSAAVSGPPGSPANTALPVVSGTAAGGSTLTVDTGAWAAAPTGFAYQWRRCDGSGGACVDIAGATTASYLVSTADASSTLRVLVVATNAAGSGGAISAPTAAVP